MDIVTLDVQSRDKSLRAKELLRQKIVPIEYYGRGVDNRSLQVDYQVFLKAYRVAGENTVVELNIDGKDKVNAIVHQVQYNPVTDEFVHIDFANVRMDEEITTKVPLEFVGIAPAVKEQSGILMPHLSEIEVRCLPKDLLHGVEVNVESLVDFHSAIHVKDLNIPDAVTVLNDPEDTVVVVVPPSKEEEPEPVAEGEGGAEGEEGAEEGTKEGEEKGGDDKSAEEGGDDKAEKKE